MSEWNNPHDLIAPFCDHVSITGTDGGLRIAFGEALPKTEDGQQQAVFRTAIFIPTSMAKGLRDLLDKVLSGPVN
jgi:hypothetical protein